MKIKFLLLSAFLIIGLESMNAQEKRQLSLKEAALIAIENSDHAKISASKVITAENELRSTKNAQYPDFNLSGQYMYLNNPDIKGDLLAGGNADAEENESSGAAPEVHQLLLGQANVALPIFSGFKLKNTIKAENNEYQAAIASNKYTQEEIGLQAINLYTSLYKAQETIELVQENLKSAEQRVKDFSDMEQNGLLAKNDLLKAELQKSTIELTLEEAKKNERVINYQLVKFLKLPEGTILEVDANSFTITPSALNTINATRADLEALQYRSKAAENKIKVAKGNYYPSLSLSAGYVALDLENALTVSNAMNVGLGLSYNLASIFKNKSSVKIAESRAQELQYSLSQLKDNISVAVKKAKEEYQLALKNEEVYKKSEEQAKENYRIVKDKYDNGLQDTNDLLEADVQKLQAEINLTYAKANIAQKYFELQKSQGNLINYLGTNP